MCSCTADGSSPFWNLTDGRAGPASLQWRCAFRTGLSLDGKMLRSLYSDTLLLAGYWRGVGMQLGAIGDSHLWRVLTEGGPFVGHWCWGGGQRLPPGVSGPVHRLAPTLLPSAGAPRPAAMALATSRETTPHTGGEPFGQVGMGSLPQ